MSSDYVKGLESAIIGLENQSRWWRELAEELPRPEFIARAGEAEMIVKDLLKPLIPVSTQPASLLCSICGRGEGYSTHDKNRHTDAWHPFSPLNPPASPLTVPACVKCGHSRVDREGRCVFEYRRLNLRNDVRYCDCKCDFPAQGDTVPAGESLNDRCRRVWVCMRCGNCSDHCNHPYDESRFHEDLTMPCSVQLAPTAQGDTAPVEPECSNCHHAGLRDKNGRCLVEIGHWADQLTSLCGCQCEFPAQGDTPDEQWYESEGKELFKKAMKADQPEQSCLAAAIAKARGDIRTEEDMKANIDFLNRKAAEIKEAAQGDTAPVEEKIGDYAKFYGACRDEQIEAQGDTVPACVLCGHAKVFTVRGSCHFNDTPDNALCGCKCDFTRKVMKQEIACKVLVCDLPASGCEYCEKHHMSLCGQLHHRITPTAQEDSPEETK